MRFVFPFPSGTVLSRGFYFKDPVYYLGQHLAADYVRKDASTYGSPLVAMEAGVLTSAWDVSGYRGWLAKIQHGLDWQTGYAHMREKSPLPDGSHVQKGQVIGYADSTGVVTGPHVHIDLWNSRVMSPEAVAKMGWYAHDPQYWIGREQQGDEDMTPEQEKMLEETHAWAAQIRSVLFDSPNWPVPPQGNHRYDALDRMYHFVAELRAISFDSPNWPIPAGANRRFDALDKLTNREYLKQLIKEATSEGG